MPTISSVISNRLFVDSSLIGRMIHSMPAEFAPGVPLNRLTPSWIPAHLLWGHRTGAVFVATGLCLIINKEARLAATWLGLMILLLVLLVYVPIVVANPSDIGNGLNYLVDTLFLRHSGFKGQPFLK